MRAVLTIGLALLAAGCSFNTPNQAPALTDPAELPAPQPPAYRLMAGDQLSLKFYNNPELDDEQPVRPDGLISLPFVGQVKAGGLTPDELERELVRRYTGELATPQVTVIVKAYAPQRYYVGGEVGSQGAYPLHGPLTLAQAIQEAGGFLSTARRTQVLLIRADAQGTYRGFAIDMKQVLSGERPDYSITLQPQDVVFVPRSQIANVNLFVEMAVRGVLPVVPGFAFDIDSDNN